MISLGNLETILLTGAANLAPLFLKRGFDQVRLVIEADPLNLLKGDFTGRSDQLSEEPVTSE